MLVKRSIYAIAMMLIIQYAAAQEQGFTKLSLSDMSAFRSQAGNWRVVGSVAMDPEIDIHPAHTPTLPAVEKKKKKSKELPPPPAPDAVTFQPGTGVLLNMNSETVKDNLISNVEHGDILLELEVMIPKGSNSGIYLQGRYEVQLLDSWGVRNPKYSDIGGIYRNWETAPDKIYMGKAPIANPAKAAGLWQKMKISFRAPKFDAQGNKIANAKFVYVELNGVKIHDNVEVPLATGGPIDAKEVALGPLMIQGDHGPVAFRNIQYKLMHDISSSVSNISYKIYHGNYKVISDFESAKPVSTGKSAELTAEVADIEDAYAIVYSGDLTVPEDNKYKFGVWYTGGARLVIDGHLVTEMQRPDTGGRITGEADLKSGVHAFEIFTFKDASWMPPRLGLTVQTETSYPQTVTAFNSFPPDDNPTSQILIQPGSEIKLLRAFLDFQGDRKQRLTHTIGVGDPHGIHYVYDLESGNLVCIWRGDFVDATPMWHDRGDGSFHPLGAIQYLFAAQPLAFISGPEAFPPVGKEGDFKTLGYEIEEGSGRPVFKYAYQGLMVEDKVYPSDENRSITHEVNLKERGTKNGLAYKVADGSTIEKMSDGRYAINDRQYYIKVLSAAIPVIRDSAGKKELFLPVDGTSVKYSIIW